MPGMHVTIAPASVPARTDSMPTFSNAFAIG
jgi:hypothetical protein